jgi:hypothetical protein
VFIFSNQRYFFVTLLGGEYLSKQVTVLFNEIEKYLQMLAKSRAIQISFEKKLLEKIEQARQAMK